MSRRPPQKSNNINWIDHIQKYWWLVIICGGTLLSGITLYGSLPQRIQKVEAGQSEQHKEIDDLKGWAREIQGYTRAQQDWQKVYQQQQEQRQPTPSPVQPDPPEHTWWAEDKQGKWWWCDNPDEKLCWTNSEWVAE